MLSIEDIKRLTIIALFSDDDLMGIFVLKGGNALSYAHNVSNRASVDVDISLPGDFSEGIDIIKNKLDSAFTRTFAEKGHRVFDTELKQKPKELSGNVASFWGGYEFSFKLIENDKYHRLKNDLGKLRKQATAVSEKDKRTFTVDISKYEYCDAKESFELEGFTIYVYPPLIIIYEKLRALCQQLVDYAKIVQTKRQSPRARDFFDIYSLMENPATTVDLYAKENLPLLQAVFDAKKVPLHFLNHLESEREFHRQDFRAVQDTVSPSVKLQSFDFYFEYVINLVRTITDRFPTG